MSSKNKSVRSEENTILQHQDICSKMNVLYIDSITHSLENNNVAINDTIIKVHCPHCDNKYNINYDRSYDLCKLPSLQHHFVKNNCPICSGYKLSTDDEGINKSVSDWQKSYLWSLFSKGGSLVKSNDNTREDDTYLCEHFSGNDINDHSEHLPFLKC
jgi:hypothetical protein